MWDPRAIIVVILAGAVSIAHIVGIAAVAFSGRTLTDVGGDVLIALVGAMIAIIAAYVSQRETPKPKEPPNAEQHGDRYQPLADDPERPPGDPSGWRPGSDPQGD